MALPLSYNVRNVRNRWQVTLLAVSGIALVVAVFTVLMAMSEGFAMALRATGRPDNAMIVQRGSASELTSWVPLDQRQMIVVRDEVARGADGAPLASPEDVVVTMKAKKDGEPTNISVRGVTPRAFEVRSAIANPSDIDMSTVKTATTSAIPEMASSVTCQRLRTLRTLYERGSAIRPSSACR